MNATTHLHRNVDAGHRAWTNVANAGNGIIALEILAEANLTK